MLRGEFDAAGVPDTDALLAEYQASLAATIDRVGPETVAEQSGVERATVEAVRDGDVADLTLTDAAAVLAADPERPDADAIAAEARDILLLGMTTAVLDVESLASAMNGTLEAKEIQQKVEGRQPMTLAEYARIHHQLGEHAE